MTLLQRLLLMAVLIVVTKADVACFLSNPEFTSAPILKQIRLTSVRVSWNKLVNNMHCVEKFSVRWWIKGSDTRTGSGWLGNEKENFIVRNLTQRTTYVFEVIAAEEGGTLDGSPSSQAEMTTGPKDCSAYSGDNMPHPRFLLLGPTGVGKSTFGNVLLGSNVYEENEKQFRMGHGADAQTTEISYQIGNWLGYGDCFTIIDTPGTSDGEGRDYENAITMANIMNTKFKTIDVFLLLANGQVTRFDQSMIDLLRLYQSIFTEGMWSNSVTEVTFWSHEMKEKKKRRRRKTTEESRHEEWNKQYNEELDVKQEIPSVYIDPMFPIFSEDEFDLEDLAADPEQERMFELYTDYLWKFSNDVAPFSCDGKCQAPSGYFIGEPWMTVFSPQEKGENETSVAVREGEGVEMSCEIWIGPNKATSVTASNVTITVNGTEVYKKVTNPFTNAKKQSHLQPFRPKQVHVREALSPGGHSTEFKISIGSFGPEMVGNLTCDNGISGANNAVDFVLRVDCSYGEWSNWSTCSKSCLGTDGIQGNKRRQRTSSPPQNGGDPCTEPLQDVVACAGDQLTLVMCPQNHKLTPWTTWSACSRPCGPGTRGRSRSCTQGMFGGTQCPKSMKNLIENDSKDCNLKPCPGCIWSTWKPWSPCTKSCLEESSTPGARTRKREFRELDPSTPMCVAEDGVEEETCSFTMCPQNHILTPWTTWSACSAKCGPGKQSRSRSCTQGKYGGTKCPTNMENFIATDSKDCNLRPCPACIVGDWKPWSSCSKSCREEGGEQGARKRKRDFKEVDPSNPKCVPEDHVEEEPCAGNHQKDIMCPQNHKFSKWTTWSACSRTCGPGTRGRSRSCTQGKYGGTQCPENLKNFIEEGRKPCNLKECPRCIWSSWKPWEPCSKSCLEEGGEHGTRKRKRDYREADPSNPRCVASEASEEKLCIGESSSTVMCPIDAKMSSWTSWGPSEDVCGQLCKDGANATKTPIMQEKSRHCMEGRHGGRLCKNLYDNHIKEARMCPSSKPCPEDCTVSDWTDWSACSKGCGPGKRYKTRRILGPFHGGADCPSDLPVTDYDTRCQAEKQNYKGSVPIKTIAYVYSWSQCLKYCIAHDACKHWVWYNSHRCELISSSHSDSETYSDSSVAASGPKTCLDSINREVKYCHERACPPCDHDSWTEWSECGYCAGADPGDHFSIHARGYFSSRSRKRRLPEVKDFVGVKLKCDDYETEKRGCGGSFWYWTVGIVTGGLANWAAC